MSQRSFIFNVCMYDYIHFEINLYKKNIAVFCGFFSLSHFMLPDMYVLLNQAQANDQFLTTTKLATNKATCLKTKNINKSKVYI